MNPNKKRNLGLTVAALAILAGIAWVSLRGTSEAPAPEQSVENPKAADVLSPALFTDPKARAAYQTAKDIPEVLEQLPCFSDKRFPAAVFFIARSLSDEEDFRIGIAHAKDELDAGMA